MMASNIGASSNLPRLSALLLCMVYLADGSVARASVVYMSVYLPFYGRLARFEQGTRTLSETFGVNSKFGGITTNADGAMLIADYGANAIQRVLPNGTVLSPFASIDGPVFVEADSRGNVYTTRGSPGPATAYRLDSMGTITQTYTVTDATSLAGVDADALANVYVCRGNRLIKFASDGTLLNTTKIPPMVSDIAIDENGGRLFLGVQQDVVGSQTGVWIFDITGEVPQYIRRIVAPAGSEITGVHFSPETGHIFLVDIGWFTQASRGLEYSDGGVLLQQYVMPPGYQGADLVWLSVPEPSAIGLVLIWTILVARNRTRDSLVSVPR